MSLKTRVIHIEHAPAGWQKNPEYVYIGRGKSGCELFGNPYKIGRDGDRYEVLEQYEQYLWVRIQNDPEFAEAVRRLNGCILVCHCAPLACHGEYLGQAAAYLEARYQNSLEVEKAIDALPNTLRRQDEDALRKLRWKAYVAEQHKRAREVVKFVTNRERFIRYREEFLKPLLRLPDSPPPGWMPEGGLK